MKAFHNDPKIKAKYLKRVTAHMKADEIIKGQYWQDGKGCAVGCTIHGDKHKDYETELGIPEWLARFEDAIFEGLPNDRAKLWPSQFLKAIKPGADLEKIKVSFVCFILENSIESMSLVKYNESAFPDIKAALEQSKQAVLKMIEAHKTGKDLSAARSAAESAWSSARSSAESAAWSAAESAARSAAESAAWSAAESAAWSARSSAESAAWSSAESAAWSSAESAAWSAESARSSAESARSSAWSAAESAARSAAWSARSAAYVKFADELLKLLKGCKP